MNTFLHSLLRSTASITIGSTSFVVYLFAFEIGFPLTLLAGTATGLASFFAIKEIQRSVWLNKKGLSRKEFRYIGKNLKEAKEKVRRLQKQQLKVRSLGAFKQILEINRLTRRIFQLVSKDPKRYYSAESFFYYHLDSVVELTEKYTFLASQPGKSQEKFLSLQQTRSTLDELIDSLENDLQMVVADDMDHLKMELTFANKHLTQNKDLK
jgi:5-bromo-4-chloroindolyl phosphate hydrolysis protein